MKKIAKSSVIRLADARKDIFDRIRVPDSRYYAPKPAPPAPAVETRQRDANDNAVAMHAIVRSMLVMATEGAYDLRAGYPDSPYLEQFEVRFEELRGRLSAVGATGARPDFRFLVSRARTGLTALYDTVQRELADRVTRDIDVPAFDGALDKVKDTAIAAGVAFGSLDMALNKR